MVDSGCSGRGGVAKTTGVATRAPTPSRTDARHDPPTVKQVQGPTPYIEIKDEPAPRLIADPSLPNLRDQGVGAGARPK